LVVDFRDAQDADVAAQAADDFPGCRILDLLRRALDDQAIADLDACVAADVQDDLTLPTSTLLPKIAAALLCTVA
jgi:hypothetical protein